MVQGVPGLDVSSLVKKVLHEESLGFGAAEKGQLGRLATKFLSTLGREDLHSDPNAFTRMFATPTGVRAVNAVGNESRTLDLLSSLSVEVLAEFLFGTSAVGHDAGARKRRFLVVPGQPTDTPALLVLDPEMDDISLSRRITDELHLDAEGLKGAFERLRPALNHFGAPLAAALAESGLESAMELMWIARPEVILSRRPKMKPLCAPSPHVSVDFQGEISTAGVFCRDASGTLGVTACLHGTGKAGTAVTIAGRTFTVRDVDAVQDLVFIPIGDDYAVPATCAKSGIRRDHAPSEAEKVWFEGAGSQRRVDTRVKSHDAGLLRKRPTIQLKVQTPADTNSGDSGAALIDDRDCVVGFGFERTGYGDFPEITDWIWADNALAALGLTAI